MTDIYTNAPALKAALAAKTADGNTVDYWICSPGSVDLQNFGIGGENYRADERGKLMELDHAESVLSSAIHAYLAAVGGERDAG